MDGSKSDSDNAQHMHRHACHALEDFLRLRRRRHDEGLWHSLSHHLRHAVYRTGLELKSKDHA